MGSDLDGAFCGNKKASAGFAGAWYYRNQQRNRDIGRAKPLPAFCGGSRGMGPSPLPFCLTREWENLIPQCGAGPPPPSPYTASIRKRLIPAECIPFSCRDSLRSAAANFRLRKQRNMMPTARKPHDPVSKKTAGHMNTSRKAEETGSICAFSISLIPYRRRKTAGTDFSFWSAAAR